MREKFGMSAQEADEEPMEEALIHFAIWKAEADREEREQKNAEMRANMQAAQNNMR